MVVSLVTMRSLKQHVIIINMPAGEENWNNTRSFVMFICGVSVSICLSVVCMHCVCMYVHVNVSVYWYVCVACVWFISAVRVCFTGADDNHGQIRCRKGP